MRPQGDTLVVRRLGQVEFAPTFEAMRAFTAARGAHTPDEIWLLQHSPIFTLGQAGRAEHILDCADIPLAHTDRGGQVTYHGPGQVIAYVLLDLHRAGLKVREVVSALEQAVIDLLAGFGVSAERQTGAPGVYVKGAKIAALGLRVRQGRCYHGVSLNVDMDLSPFARIHPCGYPGLKVTQLTEQGVFAPPERVAEKLLDALVQALRLPDEEKSS